MLKYTPLALLLTLCPVGLVVAADEGAPVGGSAASPPQEPEVTIVQHGQERIEEFRINNRIYMIKVTPAKGYPYYLIDSNGDGNFDTRRGGLDSNIVIPQWVLFSGK